MKSLFLCMLGIAALGCARTPDTATRAATSPAAKDAAVIFYKVPLGCSRKPGSVCSNKALFAVRDLDRRLPDATALVSPSGTTLAVVFKDSDALEGGRNTVDDVLEQRDLRAVRLADEAELAAHKDFDSGATWNTSSVLTRMTEAAANLFARGLVSRVERAHAISRDANASLVQAFEPIVRESLLAESFSREAERRDLVRVARAHLDDAQLDTLAQAYDQGLDARQPGDPEE